MEKISTPRSPLLPRAANLATLAVVAAATWWSAAQRPGDTAALATQAAGAPTKLAAVSAGIVGHSSQAAGGTTAGTTAWPAQATTATSLGRDSLQAVGFQPRVQR